MLIHKSIITAAVFAVTFVSAQDSTTGNNTQPALNTTQPETNSTQPETNGTQPESQSNNNTIFQILNSTDGSSPAPQIAQFLSSSPDYQPIIDLLNDPQNNLTLFLPSDQVFSALSGQQPNANSGTENGTETNNTSSSVIAGPTGSSTSESPSSTASSAIAQTSEVSQPTASSNEGINPSAIISSIMAATTIPGGFWSAITALLPADATPTVNAQYVRLPYDDEQTDNREAIIVKDANEKFVRYDYSNMVIAKRQDMDGDGSNDTDSNGNDSNSTNSNENDMSNYVTSPYASQFSVSDLIYYHLVNQSETLNDTTQIFNSLLTNQTVVPLGYGSPLVVQNGTSGNMTVGDGIGYANIGQNYTASNGIIYIIDKVLVPPVNTTETLSAVQNSSFFDMLLARSNITNDTLNSENNVTLFVPVDSVLQNMNLTSLDNQTLDNLIQAHIVQGIYYTTNVTEYGNITVSTLASTNLTLENSTEVNGNFTVNGTQVVQANILTNTGVIHLINGVLNYTSENSTEGNSTNGAFPTPSSSNVASSPTFFNMIFILSSTFLIYLIYV